MSMDWDNDLFREIRSSAAVLPPAGGTPSVLEQFEQGGRIEQPVWRRKDYLTDTWCHLNLARASRPFAAPQLTGAEETFCSFCTGNESHTPRDVKTGGDTICIGDTGWNSRAFPNLYPWLTDHGNVVESSEHKVSLKDIDEEEQIAALVTLRKLCKGLETSGLYPMVFKNQGWGASTPHTHWQYGALPYLPGRLARELTTANTFAEKWDRNVFDAIVEAEKRRGERFISEDEYVACVAPYAPRTNYETWLILKKPAPSITSAGDAEIRSLATTMTRLLRVLCHELGIDSLCVVCHQIRGENSYRLHLEVLPYKHWAGAERGFEEYAVEVRPEQVAAFLREHFA
jgi:UDPglucose--hexose-1-phosphate uridylyltransferase